MNPNGETQDPSKAPPDTGAISPEQVAHLEAAAAKQAQQAIAETAQDASQGATVGTAPPPPVDRADHPMTRLARVEVVLAKVLEHCAGSIQSPISKADAEELMEYLRSGDPNQDEDDE